MKITIRMKDRTIAETAFELATKRLDALREDLDAFQLDDVQAQTFQARVQHARDELKTDLKADWFDWTLEIRRTVGLCLRQYKAKLKKLCDAETKLFVETDDTLARIADTDDLLDRIQGQEQLFPADEPKDEAEEARARIMKSAKALVDSGVTFEMNGGDGEPPTRRPRRFNHRKKVKKVPKT